MIFKNRPLIASSWNFPEDVGEICFSILSRDSALIPSLCQNENIPSTSWINLYKSKLSLTDAINLVSRPLPSDIVDLVVKSEKRGKVLCSLLQHNSLSLDSQRLIAVHTQDAPKKTLLYSKDCHPSLRKFIAKDLSGIPLLEEITLDPANSFSHEERVDFLNNFSSLVDSSSFKEISFLLSLLFFRYPELIPIGLYSSNSSVVVAACGSVNACDSDLADFIKNTVEPFSEANIFALMALAANPATSLKTVSSLLAACQPFDRLTQVVSVCSSRLKRGNEAVPFLDLLEDESMLSLLVSRSLPSEYKPSGRPLDMVLLFVNPNISLEDKLILKNLLYHFIDPRIFKVLPVRVLAALPSDLLSYKMTAPILDDATSQEPSDFIDALNQQVSQACETLGTSTSSWECFFSLSDEFEGSFQELLQIAKSV
jgi:hypothetical protein